MSTEKTFLRALGRSSKVNEWLRPQLIGKTYFFNTPMWLSMAYKVAGNFMSTRSLEKVQVHSARLDARLDARPRARTSSAVSLEDEEEGRRSRFFSCEAAAEEEANGRLCPFALQLLGDARALPSFIGGLCESDSFPGTARKPAALHEAGVRIVRDRLRILAGLPRPEGLPALSASGAAPSDEGSLLTTVTLETKAPLSVDQRSEASATSLPAEAMDGESLPQSCLTRWCCCRRRQARASLLS